MVMQSEFEGQVIETWILSANVRLMHVAEVGSLD
jgi:hypothetical protein